MCVSSPLFLKWMSTSIFFLEIKRCDILLNLWKTKSEAEKTTIHYGTFKTRSSNSLCDRETRLLSHSGKCFQLSALLFRIDVATILKSNLSELAPLNINLSFVRKNWKSSFAVLNLFVLTQWHSWFASTQSKACIVPPNPRGLWVRGHNSCLPPVQ